MKCTDELIISFWTLSAFIILFYFSDVWLFRFKGSQLDIFFMLIIFVLQIFDEWCCCSWPNREVLQKKKGGKTIFGQMLSNRPNREAISILHKFCLCWIILGYVCGEGVLFIEKKMNGQNIKLREEIQYLACRNLWTLNFAISL